MSVSRKVFKTVSVATSGACITTENRRKQNTRFTISIFHNRRAILQEYEKYSILKIKTALYLNSRFRINVSLISKNLTLKFKIFKNLLISFDIIL